MATSETDFGGKTLTTLAQDLSARWYKLNHNSGIDPETTYQLLVEDLHSLSDITNRYDSSGILSHELTKPLQSILLAVSTLFDSNMAISPERAAKLKERATNGFVELLPFVRDAESFIKTGKVPTQKVSAMEIINYLQRSDTFKSFVYDGQGVQVLDELDSIVMRCNPAYLKHCILEAVINAKKYGFKSSSIKIRFFPDLDNGICKVGIYDSGYGFPSDMLEIDKESNSQRLFTNNARSSIHKDIRGTGKGLFFVKSAIEAQEGSVHAYNQIENGSVSGAALELNLQVA